MRQSLGNFSSNAGIAAIVINTESVVKHFFTLNAQRFLKITSSSSKLMNYFYEI
jgi:hypothetical protein